MVWARLFIHCDDKSSEKNKVVVVIRHVFSSLSTAVSRTHLVLDQCVPSAAAVVLEFGLVSFIFTNI